MKGKLMFAALVLLLAAAVVFLVLFVQGQKRIGKLKDENSRLRTTVSAEKARPLIDEMGKPGSSYRVEFISHLDGEQDSFLITPPRPIGAGRKYTLVVYLHCMGGTSAEPFLIPERAPIADVVKAEGTDIILASLSYRQKLSWCNEAACADISQNIRQMMQGFPIDKIVLLGTSMGGSAVLTYAALSPDDIKSLITGVVSIEGAGDLKALYDKTGSEDVKRGLIQAFGGAPQTKAETYKQYSFMTNLDRIGKSTKFVVVSATHDKIVPPELQKQVAQALSARHADVQFLEIDGPHEPPPPRIYREALRYVLH